jgi:hypothetical protein
MNMSKFASASYTAGQLNDVVKLLKKQGGEEGVDRFLRGELMVSERIGSELKKGDVFRLTVDYSQSLEEMVAAGHYDWKNGNITAKRFPIVGKGVVKFESHYFHFDRNISSESAVKEIEGADTANPWSPAKAEHVLSHGKTFPDEQRKFPIIGLGSVAKVYGYRLVPVLDGDDSKRSLYLNLHLWNADWHPAVRFLAVRKVSVS